MITRTKNQQFNPYLFSIHGRVILGDPLSISSKMYQFHNLVKSSTSGGTSGLKKLVLQCSIMKFNYLALCDLSYRDIIMPYAVVTAVFRVGGQGHVLRSFPGHS